MNLDSIQRIFFLGIGGIGMSALARFFKHRGAEVFGYDKTQTELTKKLEAEGMKIHYEDKVDRIPDQIDIVVYTPAIPANSVQLLTLQSGGSCPVIKRSKMLGLISENYETIAIAGTHGKTSTTAVLTHMMLSCGESVNAFVGGILSDYGTNFFAGHGPFAVLEADEYDRSFLQLHPEIAVLQSMDADHLDIYGEENKIRSAFIEFLRKTAYGGSLILNRDVWLQLTAEESAEFKSSYKVVSYGFHPDADAVLDDYEVADGMTFYSMVYNGRKYAIRQFLPGRYNVMNTTAALLAGASAGLDIEAMIASLPVYKGVRRRFERIVQRGITFIDDYAHHPTELQASIEAARSLFPGKKILGIFQPHLFSRTRDFYRGFAEELDRLDEVILMDIYPAREQPMAGVSSAMILNEMKIEAKSLLSVNQIMEVVKHKDYDVIMTLGAGDIDLLVPKIKEVLTQ